MREFSARHDTDFSYHLRKFCIGYVGRTRFLANTEKWLNGKMWELQILETSAKGKKRRTVSAACTEAWNFQNGGSFLDSYVVGYAT